MKVIEGLRNAGVLNELHSFGEVAMNRARTAVAYCSSFSCAGNRERVKVVADPADVFCPHCTHALLWEVKNVSTKRRRNETDPNRCA